LIEPHVGDLRGAEACSEAILSLCRRCATIETELERLEVRPSEGAEIDMPVYLLMVGHLRRTLESLGSERRMKPIAGDDIIARSSACAPRSRWPSCLAASWKAQVGGHGAAC
jgi:hypothetical protein